MNERITDEELIELERDVNNLAMTHPHVVVPAIIAIRALKAEREEVNEMAWILNQLVDMCPVYTAEQLPDYMRQAQPYLEQFLNDVHKNPEMNKELTDPPYGEKLENVLPQEVVKTFAQYWCDERRDESLGRFIQRVAQYAVNNIETEEARKHRLIYNGLVDEGLINIDDTWGEAFENIMERMY
jgi:hypothetical protein